MLPGARDEIISVISEVLDSLRGCKAGVMLPISPSSTYEVL